MAAITMATMEGTMEVMVDVSGEETGKEMDKLASVCAEALSAGRTTSRRSRLSSSRICPDAHNRLLDPTSTFAIVSSIGLIYKIYYPSPSSIAGNARSLSHPRSYFSRRS